MIRSALLFTLLGHVFWLCSVPASAANVGSHFTYLNGDNHLDVVMPELKITRVWDPTSRRLIDRPFPSEASQDDVHFFTPDRLSRAGVAVLKKGDLLT